MSHALGDLPLLEAELEEGTFQFSHIKELTRVLVPETEAEWIAHARGMTYREVQVAVAGHVRGDRPRDPTRPDERRRFIGFHLKPATSARLFAFLKDLETERGDRFTRSRSTWRRRAAQRHLASGAVIGARFDI